MRHSRYLINLVQVTWTITTITILLLFIIRLVIMRDLEVLMRDFILIPDYEILGCAKRTSFRKHRRGGRCRSLDLLVELGSACALLVEQRLANLATCCRLAPSSHVLIEPAHASSNIFAAHSCLAFAISKLNLLR